MRVLEYGLHSQPLPNWICKGKRQWTKERSTLDLKRQENSCSFFLIKHRLFFLMHYIPDTFSLTYNFPNSQIPPLFPRSTPPLFPLQEKGRLSRDNSQPGQNKIQKEKAKSLCRGWKKSNKIERKASREQAEEKEMLLLPLLKSSTAPPI